MKWRKISREYHGDAKLVLKVIAGWCDTVSIPLFSDVMPRSYLSYLATHAKNNHGDVLIGLAERTAMTGMNITTPCSFGSSPEQSYASIIGSLVNLFH